MMEVKMKLTWSLAALILVLTLSLVAETASGDMIEGSIVISAYWAEIDGADLASSSVFTPFTPTSGTIYLAGGTDDLIGLTFAPARADPLDINDPTTWTFDRPEGSWTTSSFVNIDPATGGEGYLDFFLTGIFTPAAGGSLSDFDPTPAEIRISLNQSGPRTSWGGTMNMVPEPMSMIMLSLGGMALLRRPKRRE
jgi:hypothetical protein